MFKNLRILGNPAFKNLRILGNWSEKNLRKRKTSIGGYLYENIVAQMLVCSGNKMFYHTWPTESGNTATGRRSF